MLSIMLMCCFELREMWLRGSILTDDLPCSTSLQSTWGARYLPRLLRGVCLELVSDEVLPDPPGRRPYTSALFEMSRRRSNSYQSRATGSGQ
jgi:hypothetical protein